MANANLVSLLLNVDQLNFLIIIGPQSSSNTPEMKPFLHHRTA